MEHRLVDDAPAKLPSGKLGRYEIVKRLATGGSSELLLARAGGSGGAERHVVIKQLREGPAKDPAFVRTFVAEARLAGKLRHPNICYVQDVGEDNGKHYVVMEYVHGEDLRTILARLHGRGQTMPFPQLVTIGTSVAAALHHAHDHMGADHKSRGLVHGDVTPTNILVGYDGIVKVVDFGIARAAIEAFELEVGGLKGKVPYMAPEQCTGQGVDRRSDVFALGIVLYELATGRRLFKGESDFVTMATIVGGTVPRPSQHRKDLPDELESILLKALARSPADRYQTAADLRMALDVFAAKTRPTGAAPTLADYMTQLFVKRQEPWLDRTERTATALDFDGAVTGLAQAPAEAVEMFAIPDAATDDSPITHAHAHAVDKPTEVVAIAKKPVALGSFVQRPRSETGGKTPRPEVSAKPPRPKAVTAGPLVQRPRPDTNGKTPRPELGLDDQTPRPGADDRTPRAEAITAGPLVQRPRPDTDGKTPRPELSDKPLTPDASGKAARPDATEKPGLPSVLKSDARPARTAGNRLPSPTQPPRPRTPSVVATPAGATPIVAPPVVTPPVVASPDVAPPVVAPPVVAPPVVAPPVVAPPVVAAPDEARSERNRLSTDVSEPTKVAAPPPPPPNASSTGFAARKGGNDSTQIVAPLPLPVAPAPRSSTAPSPAVGATAAAETAEMVRASRRKWVMRGLIGGAGVVAVILVVAIGFSNGDAPPVSPPAASDPTAAAPVQAPPPAPEPPRPERTMRNSEPPAADVAATAPADPAPEPPRPERTMRNSEPPPAADVTATAPAAPAPEPPRPERTMRNSEPPPATDVAAKVPAEPPPAKVQAPPTNAVTRSPGATRPPAPSRPPAEIAPALPKRPSPTAVAHKPAPVATPVAKAPVAKTPVKPAAKPPAKPAKSPAYDPDALFLKKP